MVVGFGFRFGIPLVVVQVTGPTTVMAGSLLQYHHVDDYQRGVIRHRLYPFRSSASGVLSLPVPWLP